MGFFRAFVPHQLVWVPFNGIFMWALGRCKQFEVDNGVEQTYMIGVGNTFCARPSPPRAEPHRRH